MKAKLTYTFTSGMKIDIFKVDFGVRNNDTHGLVLFSRNGSSKTTARALRVTARGVPYFIAAEGCRVFLNACDPVEA